MNRLLLQTALLTLLAGSAAAGPDVIIRERAKQLRDQNNARQGVTPPAPAPVTPAKPGTPAAVPPQATVLTAQQASLVRLQTDLASFKTNVTVTAEQQQRLANDLSAVAQGPNKPSAQATSRLAGNMAIALGQKPLTAAERSRLLQNLNALLNGATMPKDQMQDIVADIQKIFKASPQAAAIGSDAKTIAAEIQKTTLK
jgi:hypothetical protein